LGRKSVAGFLNWWDLREIQELWILFFFFYFFDLFFFFYVENINITSDVESHLKFKISKEAYERMFKEWMYIIGL